MKADSAGNINNNKNNPPTFKPAKYPFFVAIFPFLKPNIKNKLILNKNINKLVIVELTPTKFKILVINKSSIKKIV